MGKVENATAQMENWANDDSHGYDQQFRWGERGDYDCSSAVIQAWENAGVPVKSNGATYTGNMYSVFIRCGFKDVTGQVDLSSGSGLMRGDVLLNRDYHTAMYCGDGLEVEASINEFGGVTGGQPGDQTGYEFLIRPYRNYPWDFVLRFPEEQDNRFRFTTKQVSYGNTGIHVWRLQMILKARGYFDGPANQFFSQELELGLMDWQRKAGLDVDGVAGNRQTWPTLLGLDLESGQWIVDEVRIGDMGSKSVLLCQEFLKASGYYADYTNSEGEVIKASLDWDFGPILQQAVIKFQKAANKSGAKLRTDGVFDAATARWMIGDE